ncbi:MAG TPA: hypothetical protein VM008_13400 [Phycisphaerae bacterium]|nr:hypothetical protein [Phycisphaerae bacterium]
MSEKMHGNGTFGGAGSDLVERGVRAIREKDGAIPALPESLVRRTIERAGAGEVSKGSGEGWFSMKMVRRYSVAAGLTVLAGMGIAVGLLGRGTVAFADVVQQVQSAKAVRCTLTVKPDGGKKSAFDVLMVEPGWVIERGAAMTMITSSADHKMMTLTPATKQAVVIDWKKDDATGQVNLLETFKNVSGKESKKLGTREIDGHQTEGFEFSQHGMEMEVWADTKTQLPVKVETDFGAGGWGDGAGNGIMRIHASFSDFDWNPVYDASELTMKVPEGYTATNAAMNLKGPTEQDVVVMLKTFGEMNGGVMPKGVGAGALGEVMAKGMQKKMPANMSSLPAEERQKLQQQMTAEAMKMAEPIARGWAFMGDAKFGSEWRYAGGAVAGKKGTAVLWYKPAGKETWRVIDADGTVREEKEAPSGGEAVSLFGAAAK